MCLIYPTHNPQHQCITGVSSVLWAGQTLPAAFYQWTTTSSTSWGVLDPKWCLQHQPAQIPASVTQDFRDWFSAQSCPLHSKSTWEPGKKPTNLPKKTNNNPNKQKHFEIAISGYLQENGRRKLAPRDLSIHCLFHNSDTELYWNTDTALGTPNTKELSTFGKAQKLKAPHNESVIYCQCHALQQAKSCSPPQPLQGRELKGRMLYMLVVCC